MKETLISLLRHALTALACLGTFLYAQGYIGEADVATVNASGLVLSDALLPILVAVLMRLFLKFSGKVIGAHVNEEEKNDNRGLYGLLLLLGTAGLFGLALPSCSPAQLEAVRSIPVRASFVDKQGRVWAYDPRTGVSVMVVDDAK